MAGRVGSWYTVLRLQSDASVAGTTMPGKHKRTAQHQRGRPRPGVLTPHEDAKGGLQESCLLSVTKPRPRLYFSNLME